MKLENIDFDVGDVVKRSSVKASNSYTIVEAMYGEFRKFLGTTKSRVINIVEDSDMPGDWPTMDKYRAMDVNVKLNLNLKMRHRLSHVLTGLTHKLEPSYRYRYKATCTYIGNGSAAIWWRYIIKRKKDKDGVTP